MDWILNHWHTLVAIALFVVAGWKARKNGTLNAFLVTHIEELASDADKKAIKADAIEVGVQGLLDKVVAVAGLKKSSET